MTQTSPLSRRNFIGSGLAAAAALSMPVPAFAGKSYRINMTNAHTAEKFNHYVVENGRWVREALAEFDWFARDWRLEETYPMDTDTMQILIQVQAQLESSEPFRLLSGYRTPKTNSSLRGAAKNSLHIRGKALDITHPSRSPSQIQRAAVALKAGGVGYYPSNHFVHIDSGRVRYWRKG